LIEVESLHCAYGDNEVLREISLRVEPGEMTALLGPNGSGKTTLLLAMAGVMRPRSGTIRIGGEEIAGKGPRWISRRVASVPQSTEVSFPFTCLSVVLMGRYPYLDGWGGYSARDLDLALTAMEQTRIAHLAHRHVREVSGGEAQMVAIARALAQQTEILLLDEATSNLDVTRKIQLFGLLKQKNRRGGTLLFVMHDLNLAALYCRRILFLKNGRILFDGNTEEVFNDKTLSEVYETEIRVSRHPVTGSPQAHFVPHPDSDSGDGPAVGGLSGPGAD
jgi:iron complex transport system ATP-binding protein